MAIVPQDRTTDSERIRTALVLRHAAEVAFEERREL